MGARMARNGPKKADLQRLAGVLGKRLRELRNERGLTQRAAAARIGVGPLVLRKLERGSANPSLALSLIHIFRARRAASTASTSTADTRGRDLRRPSRIPEKRCTRSPPLP